MGGRDLAGCLGIVIADDVGLADDFDEEDIVGLATEVVVEDVESDVDEALKAVGDASFSLLRISGSFKRSIFEEEVEWVGPPF